MPMQHDYAVQNVELIRSERSQSPLGFNKPCHGCRI